MNSKYFILRLSGYKTFDEMYKELESGKRKEISYEDGQRSAALTRALYPKNTRYPKEGDVYICIEDAEINYMTHWIMKAFTGGDKTIFPKDEKIKISPIKHAKPISVYCLALDKEKIEKLLVPLTDREQYDYDGYSLSVDTLTLNKKFKLVDQ